ncbi:hypothetical protein ACOME3_008062 [Neoechinorhynchus agilis]
MALYQLIIAPDAAYQCIAKLGDISCVHFRDLNTDTNPFEKKYVADIKRCADMQQTLRTIEHEIELEKLSVPQTSEMIEPLEPNQIMELEASIDRMEEELSEVTTNARSLIKNLYSLKELKFVLECVEQFLTERSREQLDVEPVSYFVEPRSSNQIVFGHPLTETLEDPTTGEREDKVMFVVYYQGEQLKDRVEKTCRGFGANVYPCPKNPVEVQELLAGVLTRIEDIRMILDATEGHRRAVLMSAAQKLKPWKIQLLKTKSIYCTLNMFNTDMSKRSLFGECWIPVSEFGNVQMALRRGTEESGSDSLAIINRKSTLLTPPTYFKTNKLTAGFMDIIHAYGVADYQEMSPASFTVISFPFLFGVMFGDFGHGILLTLVGAFMCIYENQMEKRLKRSEALHMLFSGRYIILLMGLFGIYAGLISKPELLLYNDIFGLSVNIFGSSWRVNYDYAYLRNTSIVQLEPSPYNHTKGWVQMYSGNPYTFGIDPIWALAKNKILFLNSMKMKFSIIIGVTQMVFGIFLHLTNILHFDRREDILFDFVPEIVFFLAVFFYLVVLIFYKWTHYNGSTDPKWGAACAPSLLVHYINTFLMSYPKSPCSMATFYTGQQAVQTFLILLGIMCIPLMLIPKPLLEIRRRKRNQQHLLSPRSESSTRLSIQDSESSDVLSVKEKPISEIIVDRSIHTIEFFLNSISSTASYLRLWALSLAHAELSEVLWQMVMSMAFKMNGKGVIAVASYALFFAWSVFTLAILVCMEGLSAFLHVLRLHWVEFQSKFYRGEGYNFDPFSYNNILKENDLY